MRDLFSKNTCPIVYLRKPFDIRFSRLVPISPWYTDGTRWFIFCSRIHLPYPLSNLRRFALDLKRGVRGPRRTNGIPYALNLSLLGRLSCRGNLEYHFRSKGQKH
jgi:hypothetical protein